MKPKTITILIADDHKLFRSALIKLIGTFNIAAKVDQAENGRHVLQFLKDKWYDVILLDIQMPLLSGVDVMKEIQNVHPQPKVIVLTQFVENLLITYLLQLGVHGFLNKNCEPSELKKAILSVAKNNYYYNAEALLAVQSNLTRDHPIPTIAISRRELEVMSLLKDGKSNKEISSTLKLSLRTIESYRKSLMKKTNCRNVAEVVRLAYRTGLVAQ